MGERNEKTEMNSICYMSLADAFITRLRRDAEKRSKHKMTKGISVEVLPVTVNRKDFMCNYLMKLHQDNKGTFSKAKLFAKQTIYECERSNLCKGKSSGDPTKTRANGCSAYVSFMFEEGATVTACVIRSRIVHCGHNPCNKEEARVSRIDLALKRHIETHIRKGLKIKDVMNEVVKWNRIRKNTDLRNRRYFPSRQDVQQLSLSLSKPNRASNSSRFLLRKHKKFELVKEENITQLLRTEFHESCVYYQPHSADGYGVCPLIIVLQNPKQREMALAHGQQVVFLEQNYEGLCQNGNIVYVLVVRDNYGNSSPVAYIITSTVSSCALIKALQKLRERCLLSPRVFFLQRELQRYTDMMSTIFPDSIFLISWYGVIQDIHRWLQTSPVSEKEHADVRKVLLQFVQGLRSSRKEEDFLFSVSEMHHKIEFEAFTSLLKENFLPYASMWCNYRRNFFQEDSKEGFQMEWVFLRIKHQFLKGVSSRKSVEDLVTLTQNIVTEHQNFMEGVVDVSALLEGTASDQATSLLHQGWSQLVTWQGQWVAFVPSDDILDLTYQVNLITMECDCPSLTRQGPCLHLCMIMTLVKSYDGATPEQERRRCAKEAFENCDYTMDVKTCTTFHNNVICITELDSRSCTCVAGAFGIECVGKFLMKMVVSLEEPKTFTVPSNTDPLQAKSVCSKNPTRFEAGNTDGKITSSHDEKTVSKLTISVQTGKNAALDFDESLSKISSETLIIQTCTGLAKETRESEVYPSSAIPCNDNITVSNVKVEFKSPEIFVLPSQVLIEKLYKWSKSKDFKDSKAINDHLQNAYNLISKSSGENKCEVWQRIGHPCRVLANKSLRTTLQSVKRPCNRLDDESDKNSLLPVLPALKVSRSGRTIKVKDKPDFIM